RGLRAPGGGRVPAPALAGPRLQPGGGGQRRPGHGPARAGVGAPVGRRPGSTTPVQVTVVEDGGARVRPDQLATEEPMDIRVAAVGERRTVAVTMRTPGADFELAAGFLFSEGVVAGRDGIRYCLDRDVQPDQRYNV